MSLAALSSSSGVSRHTAERVAAELAELGLLTIDDGSISPLVSGGPRVASAAVETAGRRRQAVLGSRIDSMRHYAETVQCRRAELLGYFGESLDPPCNNCDNDAAFHPTIAHPPAHPSGAVATGAAVVHRLWGPGTLLHRDDHELVVSF